MNNTTPPSVVQQLFHDASLLTIPRLKEVLKSLGERVGGNKPELLTRLRFALEQSATRPDRLRDAQAALSAAKLVQSPAPRHAAATTAAHFAATLAAPRTAPNTAVTPNNAAFMRQYQPRPPAPTQPQQPQPKPLLSTLNFRSGPFYNLGPQKMIVRSFPCDTGRAQLRFQLSQYDLNTLENQVLLLLVGQESGIPLKENPFKVSGIPVEYPPLAGAHSNAPNHCGILINGVLVSNQLYSGIRGKPWTAKPLELNKFLHKIPATQNTIELKFTPLTENRNLLVIVQFASRVEVARIVEEMKTTKIIDKDAIVAERRNKAVADADVMTTEEHVSLKDPVTRCRINVPARGNLCRHPQCFDLEYYLQLNQTHPTWSCPVCSKLAPINEVFVDGYFLELLQTAALDSEIESAEIAMDGTWTLNRETMTGVASDDSEDEERPPAKKQRMESAAPSSSAQPEVVDLTLSDDDEPIQRNLTPPNQIQHSVREPVPIRPSIISHPPRETPAPRRELFPVRPNNTSAPNSTSTMSSSASTNVPAAQSSSSSNPPVVNTSFVQHSATRPLPSSFGPNSTSVSSTSANSNMRAPPLNAIINELATNMAFGGLSAARPLPNSFGPNSTSLLSSSANNVSTLQSNATSNPPPPPAANTSFSQHSATRPLPSSFGPNSTNTTSSANPNMRTPPSIANSNPMLPSTTNAGFVQQSPLPNSFGPTSTNVTPNTRPPQSSTTSNPPPATNNASFVQQSATRPLPASFGPPAPAYGGGGMAFNSSTAYRQPQQQQQQPFIPAPPPPSSATTAQPNPAYRFTFGANEMASFGVPSFGGVGAAAPGGGVGGGGGGGGSGGQQQQQQQQQQQAGLAFGYSGSAMVGGRSLVSGSGVEFDDDDDFE
ncbi:SUMO ligase siz1, partial [Podochytrium sp. JEL0797]